MSADLRLISTRRYNALYDGVVREIAYRAAVDDLPGAWIYGQLAELSRLDDAWYAARLQLWRRGYLTAHPDATE